MLFGASMFSTDYSMGAGELARALEERGFESVWARHFGTELGTPKPTVFALESVTSERRSTLFDPSMRSSF